VPASERLTHMAPLGERLATASSPVAIVTGAARGIGAAIARRLAHDGYALVVNDVAPTLDLARDSVVAAGGRAEVVVGDVADETTAQRLVETAQRAFGRCDLLVNNAGYLRQVAFERMSVADWDRMIAVHLRGTFLCCRAVVPVMIESGGAIVNVASQLGQKGGAELAHYVSAKAGIIGLTKALAHELSGRGIRVNAVAPGPIETPLVQEASADWRRRKLGELPLGRFGDPEDVAAAVAFLASSEARLFVGQTLGPNSGDVML